MKNYTEKDLVDFGNYLLSDKRDESIFEGDDENVVYDADLANWKDQKVEIK